MNNYRLRTFGKREHHARIYLVMIPIRKFSVRVNELCLHSAVSAIVRRNKRNLFCFREGRIILRYTCSTFANVDVTAV